MVYWTFLTNLRLLLLLSVMAPHFNQKVGLSTKYLRLLQHVRAIGAQQDRKKFPSRNFSRNTFKVTNFISQL